MRTAPLLLYSANTWLAYAVAERYYGGIHFAWCSPCYDGATAAFHVNIPPTSSPAERYRILAEETRRGERHSDMISNSRKGILKGAEAHLAAGHISEACKADIDKAVEAAQVRDFRPVLYIIPFDAVRDMVIEVPVPERAHPLSIEYRVEALPRNCFDVLELKV